MNTSYRNPKPRELQDNDPMPFGRYRGKPMIDVPAPYFLFLYNSGCNHPQVKQYIINDLDALNKEAAKIKR